MFWNYTIISKEELAEYKNSFIRRLQLQLQVNGLRKILREALRNDFKYRGRYASPPTGDDMELLIDELLIKELEEDE